jgi:hypothetical protein
MAALLGAAALCGCGGAAHRSQSGGSDASLRPMPVIGAAPLSREAPASLARRAPPRVGATELVDASGARLAVTLRRVVDPLPGSGARLPRGTRAVAVIVQIRSSGPSTYDSSATGDITIRTSGGVVTPVLATRGICKTPLNDFDRYITRGEDRVGCVVFAVRNGATLDAVWFSPHARRLGRLTWAP